MKSTSPAGPVTPDAGALRSEPESAPRRAQLVAELDRISDKAARSIGGWEDVWLDVGGEAILIRFAGPAMSERLLPALRHLRIEPAERPMLTVRVWDSVSTGTEPPRPAWGTDAYREHGMIDGFFGDGFYTVYPRGVGALNVVDAQTGRGFFWIADAARVLLPEQGAPLRVLLNLWLADRDVQLVHGAAIGREDGCVLLIGPSGAGKTSTALSCLDSGLRHLGEDYCLIRQGEPPQVFSIYSSAKVEPAALERMPRLQELVVSMPVLHQDEKALLDVHATRPGAMMRSARLKAIAVPRIVSGPETRVLPGSAAAALAAVAPSTMLQLPGNGPHLMRMLSATVRSVPCFALEVGSDPLRIPPVVESLLDQL
jgi:hypothetical protein